MSRAIVPGSLSALSQATNQSLAQSFMSADCILLADMSGSMSMHDAPGGKSRYDAAEAEIIRLQKDYPGRIALVSFSDTAVFCPAGIPDRLGGGTDMAKALRFILPADDTGMRLILISDGQPNNAEETLNVARQFKSAIQTIFVGPELDITGGRKFLEKLAQATGGQSLKSAAPGLLGAQVEKLLLGEGE